MFNHTIRSNVVSTKFLIIYFREFAAEEIDAYNLLNDLKPLQKKTVQVIVLNF